MARKSREKACSAGDLQESARLQAAAAMPAGTCCAPGSGRPQRSRSSQITSSAWSRQVRHCGVLAEHGVSRFGIDHAVARDFPQLVFLDGIADADVHEAQVKLLRGICNSIHHNSRRAGMHFPQRTVTAFAGDSRAPVVASHSHPPKACLADAAVLKPRERAIICPRGISWSTCRNICRSAVSGGRAGSFERPSCSCR